uniref:DUF4326 domain-containing protein n=1 Tax=Candidatus Kentrum sp. LFY TaxID=2126342 RepID=A0A450UNV5_9GAMM|nr:MAG: protein of unknown function (DUF4326) [Candidatus Kentron sp. LFY]
MNTQQIPTVLIAYPKGFSCYGKFERKMSRILSNLSDYRLAFLSDHHEFVSRYYSSDGQVHDSLSQLDEEHIEEVTHAIIFNDRESYKDLIERAKQSRIIYRVISAETTRVINIDKENISKGKNYVYIGRGSHWGNPYAIGFDGDRDEVMHKFKYDFERGFLKFTKEDAIELKGKTLGCYCKPAACHGDVIAEYLNSLDDGK